MKSIFCLALLAICATTAKPETRYIQKFELWGLQDTQTDKLKILTAFTNGFFFARPEFEPLRGCMSSNVSYEQAIAMIDKFYKANPEKWNLPFAEGVVLALTVNNGPCPQVLNHQ